MTEKSDTIWGRRPIIEAIESGEKIKKITMAKNIQGETASEIHSLAKEMKITVESVDKAEIDRIAPGENHQGIVAWVSPFSYSEITDIIKLAKKREEKPFVLVVDHLKDPHNLGALLRTGEVAGVHGVIIPRRRAVSINATVNKVAAGAARRLPVVSVANIARTVDELKKEDFWIFGADMDGETYYTKADYKDATAIVFGDEGKGISTLVKEKCDMIVKIPMKGKVASLNVSVAGGLLMYEVLRQRENW